MAADEYQRGFEAGLAWGLRTGWANAYTNITRAFEGAAWPHRSPTPQMLEDMTEAVRQEARLTSNQKGGRDAHEGTDDRSHPRG